MKPKSEESQKLYRMMLAILSDRNQIMQKKQLEHSNAVYNEYLNSRK